jgi:hypothetical protein
MQSKRAKMTDGWRQWIATNLLSGAKAAELVPVLQNQGFSRSLAEQEVMAAAQHPYVFAGTIQAEQRKKRDWVLNTQSKLQEMSPNYGQVPAVSKISTEDFFEQFYFQNRPVVIKNMLDHWPALTQWLPDYFKNQCGQQIVEVQFGRNADPLYEINQTQYKKQMPFADYVDLICMGEETNDYYMTANNTSINGSALEALWADVPLIPEYMKVQDPYPGFFWLGPKGTVTPLHHDLTNNFMAQVVGRKLVYLVPPARLPDIYNYRHCYSEVDPVNIDNAKFPAFRRIKPIPLVLEPGDLFFLPVGYWHYVLSLDISITMTYTNFLVDNDFNSFYESYGYL